MRTQKILRRRQIPASEVRRLPPILATGCEAFRDDPSRPWPSSGRIPMRLRSSYSRYSFEPVAMPCGEQRNNATSENKLGAIVADSAPGDNLLGLGLEDTPPSCNARCAHCCRHFPRDVRRPRSATGGSHSETKRLQALLLVFSYVLRKRARTRETRTSRSCRGTSAARAYSRAVRKAAARHRHCRSRCRPEEQQIVEADMSMRRLTYTLHAASTRRKRSGEAAHSCGIFRPLRMSGADYRHLNPAVPLWRSSPERVSTVKFLSE